MIIIVDNCSVRICLTINIWQQTHKICDIRYMAIIFYGLCDNHNAICSVRVCWTINICQQFFNVYAILYMAVIC